LQTVLKPGIEAYKIREFEIYPGVFRLEMPPKRSKRKANEPTPAASDPFSAAKRKRAAGSEVDEACCGGEEVLVVEEVAVGEVRREGEQLEASSEVFKRIFARKKAEKGVVERSSRWSSEDFAAGMEGKQWNLKIVTWNINGIRAWIEVGAGFRGLFRRCLIDCVAKHGGLDYVRAEDPDIFCCQETKCDKLKIPSAAQLQGYHCYWLSGVKQGYSGTGLMTKTKPISVKYEFGKYERQGWANLQPLNSQEIKRRQVQHRRAHDHRRIRKVHSRQLM
jgi:hypothetical protein